MTLLEQRHPSAIDLGLERIAGVAARMELARTRTPVISVAGTNGKGSCVAIIEALSKATGICVGVFTSPHLLVYNERIRIDGENVSDVEICRAFTAIERARGDISLSYFEFSALAALYLFAAADLDLVVLEVGLGGRLDAVNMIDADVAVITSIDLDHQQWLGDKRSDIAREKAGIARRGRPLVCTDTDPPDSLLTVLDSRGAELILLGQQGFTCRVEDDALSLVCIAANEQTLTFEGLPLPRVPLASAVAAVQALLALGSISVDIPQSVRRFVHQLNSDVLAAAFSETRLPGRFQRLSYRGRQLILDVAHNPAAAGLLARRLAEENVLGLHCVFGVLGDKDIPGVIEPLLPMTKSWHLCSLPETERSADVGLLAELVYNCAQLSGASGKGLPDMTVQCYDAPEAGLRGAVEVSVPEELIVVFGSFYTVAAALNLVRSVGDTA